MVISTNHRSCTKWFIHLVQSLIGYYLVQYSLLTSLLYRYAITTGNNEHKFRIDPVLGHVIPNAPLDYEHTSSLHLQVEARDNPTNPANQRRALCQVDVALVDVNDNKPIFSEMTYYAKIRETSSIGHDVIWAHASDRDSGMLWRRGYKSDGIV